MAESSFYSDTPNFATDFPTQNDGAPTTGNTPAPSSFYPNGGGYVPLAVADDVLSAVQALVAQADADAANAATSAANASSAVQAAAGTTAPLVDGTAAVGTSTKWAHEDHVHPTDTSRADAAATTAALALKAPLVSPALTGTPTAPTATAGTNTTQLATTAFTTVAVAAEATLRSNADALLAPLASPALTGTPTAPTPTTGDNSAKVATTAFVASEAVRYDAAQSLTGGQKTQACANIGVTAIGTAAVGQIPGTTSGTGPSSGNVGERISASTTFNITTSGTVVSGGSITLPAGVWDVEAFVVTGGPGATSTSDIIVAISTVSASVSGSNISTGLHYRAPAVADLAQNFTHTRTRVGSSANTTYYHNMQATFTGASYGGNGVLQATRVS